jgi:mono/diheme cytochrome c family protein
MNINSRQFHKLAKPSLPLMLAAFAASALVVPAPAQRVLGSDVPNAGNTQITIKQAKIKDVPASSGQQMYTAYCAVCHGTTGAGNGPAAPALRLAPTNLAMLSQRNNGKFPAAYIKHVLTDVEPQRANGSSPMPNWCPAFRALDPSTLNPLSADMRVYNLVTYLKTLQAQVPKVGGVRADDGHQH